jgi:hypothetical protein
LVVEAIAFLFFAFLHLRGHISLGSFVVEDPRRPYAVIVESVAALALTIAAVGVIARRRWAQRAAVVAQSVALAGVLWGMIAIAAGRGPHTQLNDTFHRSAIAVLLAGNVWLIATRNR